jgi:hypothetical protein
MDQIAIGELGLGMVSKLRYLFLAVGSLILKLDLAR